MRALDRRQRLDQLSDALVHADGVQAADIADYERAFGPAELLPRLCLARQVGKASTADAIVSHDCASGIGISLGDQVFPQAPGDSDDSADAC